MVARPEHIVAPIANVVRALCGLDLGGLCAGCGLGSDSCRTAGAKRNGEPDEKPGALPVGKVAEAGGEKGHILDLRRIAGSNDPGMLCRQEKRWGERRGLLRQDEPWRCDDRSWRRPHRSVECRIGDAERAEAP